ncbi:D-alanine--D-alanine ligase [Lederbergia lenta]|uniref:D-alanine--D-alanine ligase n=1 Tax=Lederbergia lenta TaxID=1467 RepID=A0A2X4W2X5_LEDLE|nr:D-alanine--D-alanine ligase [Lederbergia lenta]MCM3112293.1 D-alanine--D-alanine ligase [Lederbergia lenta]MEC2326513.1 D-alanine--D-alanine ligase [Lederbergia lenta]SQI53242.1 D-alanine/D-alanine ligase [Lederbergia lenta]
MKIKLCLLYGGKSAEHEVSLQTAKAVTQALNTEKFAIFPIYITKEGKWIKGKELIESIKDVKELTFKEDGEEIVPHALNASLALNEEKSSNYDVIFPLLHGPNGEDGTVQGMLELLNIPYVGNGVLSSSAAMDKVIMKNLFAQEGLDQVKYTWFIRSTWEAAPERAYEKVESELGYPCFVKPANLGSSVGISKCDNRADLENAFSEAFKYDRKIIIEEGVTAREIEVGVLGNDYPECSVAGEIVPKKGFYDYQSKYVDGNTELVIPADISAEEYTELRSMAVRAFRSLDCSGLVRADFFITNDGRTIINEVNTMPGFTPFSMFPLVWKHTGVDYPELIERMIHLAVERHQEKQNIIHTF